MSAHVCINIHEVMIYFKLKYEEIYLANSGMSNHFTELPIMGVL